MTEPTPSTRADADLVCPDDSTPVRRIKDERFSRWHCPMCGHNFGSGHDRYPREVSAEEDTRGS